MAKHRFKVIVVGSGHAGAEAAWAAANLLPAGEFGPGAVGVVTLDAAKTGAMSCNPAIGGLAKGQLVREIDALGGLMGLAADATGIQFKVLNPSKGAAVHGPRCQSDKHAYAEAVQRLLHAREEVRFIQGAVEQFLTDGERVAGVRVGASPRRAPLPMDSLCRARETFHGRDGDELDRDGSHSDAWVVEDGGGIDLLADVVIVTTGTFMRGLMHTGEQRTPGGRTGEGAALGISASLGHLGFELGRLKTGTPPRMKRSSLDWDALEPAGGDERPVPFSELTNRAGFPELEQVACRVTRTNALVHRAIRANLDRAPMFSGQIESAGPRYCPSIEDKVVRFAERDSHHVFLEPESLRDEVVYANGIATSLPADVQDILVRQMEGCERAEILCYGYAVEYDVVLPHQIRATCETRSVDGLFLAGQINGTSGYEEAAAQGLVAGINGARRVLGEDDVVFGRDEAYIGVLMDDLVTKTPREPYRMFTSRAEHRLVLRADNAPERLTPIAERLGLLGSTELGRERLRRFGQRRAQVERAREMLDQIRMEPKPDGSMSTLGDACRRPEFGPSDLARALSEAGEQLDEPVVFHAHAERRYEPYLVRQGAEIRRQREQARRAIPEWLTRADLSPMRAEAIEALTRFRPATFAQAARLEGITPADLTLLTVLLERRRRAGGASVPSAS